MLELKRFKGITHRDNVKAYQEKVGSVLYTAIMIRVDITYAASLLSQFLTNPGPEYMAVVN